MTKIRLHFRRRRENKTDYKKRLSLIRSGKPRLVVRQTNTRIIMQIIGYTHNGDVCTTSATSDELKKIGWNFSTKNLPAAYLTGLLLTQKARKQKVTEAIVDLGLRTPLKGSRMFSAIKGAIDGGLKIPAENEIFPPADRLTGKHIGKGELTKEFESLKGQLMK